MRSEIEKKAIVDQIWSLYCENPARYHVARRGYIYMPKTGDQPLPLVREKIEGHLSGEFALCVFGQTGASRFICFDVDHGGMEMVRRVVAALKELGFDGRRIYVSTSGGKGHHIEMFFTNPIEYAQMKRLYRELLTKTEATSRDIELRPSEKRSIKIPLGRHHKTGKRCWYIDMTTETEIHDLRYVLRIKRIETPVARQIMAKCCVPPKIPGIRKPCESVDLTALPQLTQRGMRHDTMLNIAVTVRNRGYSMGECKRVLQIWYWRQPEELIAQTKKMIDKEFDRMVAWTYQRNCYPSGKAIFFPSDIARITSIRSMTGRAFYFHVLAWERVMKEDRTTNRYLAKLFGTALLSVERAKAWLIKHGYIEAISGQHHRERTGYTTDKTRIVTAGDVVLDSLDAKTVEVAPMEMKESFWKIYFDTLFTLADENDILPKLCKKERDKLAEVRRHEG